MRDNSQFYYADQDQWEFVYPTGPDSEMQVISTGLNLSRLGLRMPEQYGYARKCIAAAFLGMAVGGRGYPWQA